MNKDRICVLDAPTWSDTSAVVELAKDDVRNVAGGLNPQPLPPFVDPTHLAFKLT